ncbi:sulfotransferase [Alteromonas sp.]|jgi:hypothetical protein|uniref:sulfotransferase n=1 Tax=Alteromonas sp. TaxID=232 RepID=UPI003AE787B2|tara:strand:+ start:13574 stop:14503 length:930 start_codon:yes stop_codon:yes gene_type:complete
MSGSGSFKELMSELSTALSDIEGNSEISLSLKTESSLQDSESLLSQCSSILQGSNHKPKLRIIHHLACSGGTLISKCVAAQPNAFLLSELHPTTRLHMGGGKPKFLPSDVTTQARYANVPNVDELAWRIFQSNIDIASKHIANLGGHLVIRDHTHSDYCVGKKPEPTSSIVYHLESKFEILSVATIRNPIDSYLSLVANNWEHFEPKGFDEYCKRVECFVDSFQQNQIIKYEDIVENPQKYIKKLVDKLEMPYSDSFIDTFSAFNVTGDSGRSGDVISPRKRRELSESFLREVKNSKSFKKISNKFGYE